MNSASKRSGLLFPAISGTGSDGSRGLVDIHEAGGLVIVQEPRSAQFDGMPMKALETGVVDLVINPEQMASALIRYGQTSLEDRMNFVGLEPPNTPMERIFRLLWEHHGIDFSHYKAATITRRIERRLELSEDLDIDAYVARLSNDTTVLDQLYRDLLIGVTQFFRDQDAFTYLEENVLPDLLQEAERTRELRIWVADARLARRRIPSPCSSTKRCASDRHKFPCKSSRPTPIRPHSRPLAMAFIPWSLWRMSHRRGSLAIL